MEISEEAVAAAGKVNHPHTGLQLGTDCGRAVLEAAGPIIRKDVIDEIVIELDHLFYGDVYAYDSNPAIHIKRKFGKST